ncbi:MAG: carboxypeptidase regulatory-like domain-containing protein [Pseudomonadota bacterium]
MKKRTILCFSTILLFIIMSDMTGVFPPANTPVVWKQVGVCFAEIIPAVDMSANVQVTTSNARSTLDRQTRKVTQTADVTIKNSSSATILSPLWAVINISTTGVTMPVSTGTWTGPEGIWSPAKYYFDLSSSAGTDGLMPGESVTFKVTFVHSSTIRFTYSVPVYGPAASSQNISPVANAGPDQTITLASGATQAAVTLNGSQSNDSDGTIASYNWSGTPEPNDVVTPSINLGPGTYTFSLVVTDNKGAQSAPDTVIVTVVSPNIPPVADAGESQIITLQPGALQAVVTLNGSLSKDRDGTIAGYNWSGLSGAPDPIDVVAPEMDLGPGTYTFVLVVTDNKGAQSTPDQVIVTVADTGGPPQISLDPHPSSVTEGGTLSFNVRATDPDGDAVTLSASPKIENATFTATSGQNAIGTFSMTPGFDQQGKQAITFKAIDPWGQTATVTAVIDVANVNHSPVLTVPAPLSVDVGKLLTATFTAQDSDGDSVLLSMTNLPEKNAIFIQATGTLAFSPDYDQSGSYTATCSVTDGVETVTAPVIITVNDIPGGGGNTALELKVNPVQTPTLLSTAQISGTVNGSGGAVPPRITSAVISGMMPTGARQGETLVVVLTGQNSGTLATHFVSGKSDADFGDGVSVESLTVVSPTELNVNLKIADNAEPGLRQVQVVTETETALAMPAFLISQGGVSVTGKLVDPDTGVPLSGALVMLEGTGFSTTSTADGSFSFTNVQSGDYTVIVNAPDHELIRLALTAGTVGAYDMGDISPAVNAFTQTQFPPISLQGVLSRSFLSSDDRRTIEELEKVVSDAILLVGGRDIGLLDEYGNQLNPHVKETPYFQMKQNAVKTIAMRMKVESPTTLSQLLFAFTNTWPWQRKPDVLMWLYAIQQVVNDAWSNPFSPENRLFILLFNNGKTLTPDPPVIVPDLPLNALQATLLRLSLFKMAAQLMNPSSVFNHLPPDYFSRAEGLDRDVFLASKSVPGADSKSIGRERSVWRHIASLLPVFPTEAHAVDLIAKAARSKENGWVGYQLTLDGASSVFPNGVGVTLEWSVTSAPNGSLGNAQFRIIGGLSGARKRKIGFLPDEAGEYTIQLVVKTVDLSPAQESAPYEITVVARHFPCDPRGLDPEWEDEEVVNLERPWTSVMCTMATDEAVATLGGVVDDLVASDLKTIILDNFDAIGIDLSYADPGTSTAGDLDSRLKANKMFMERVEVDIKATNKNLKTNPTAFEKYMPDAMEASKDNPTSLTKIKGIVKEQLLGTLSYFQDEADKLGESIMYAFMDIMIDKAIVSFKPSPPNIQYVDVVDADYDPNKKIALVVFRRSPDDPGLAVSEATKSNRHFYYRLWRENRGGLTPVSIGPEGKRIVDGPVPMEEGNPNSDLLLFVDPHPEEGLNRYFLQTRRLIGKTVPSVTMWSDAEFFFANYVVGGVCPPAAVQYNFSKGLMERGYRMLTETRLQDSDMSAPEAVYVPRPFERPKPISSLAKSPDQRLYMSLPWANAVFEFKGANVVPYFNCGFMKPYQTGFAIDANGYYYSVNSASEAQFGGRIFRWVPGSTSREFFGAVNYYSRDLNIAHPSAVQSMVAGISWGKHGLFLTDLYSGTLRYLDIPVTGELPPGDLFHNCTHSLAGAPDIAPEPKSSLTIQRGGDVLMTQGDNVFRYTKSGDFGMMFTAPSPFQSLTGIDTDAIGNLYVADSTLKTITEIPQDSQHAGFYNMLKDDPAIRSLYTLATNIESPGELRIGSRGSALVWFDGNGYNSRQFGLSGRLIDGGTRAPVGLARINCEAWGNTLDVQTDDYGVFHLPGLRVPDATPPSVTLLIRDTYGRAMTVVIKSLDREGETFLDPLIFSPEPPPTPSYAPPGTTPPPQLVSVPITLPAPDSVPGPQRHKPLITPVRVPHRSALTAPSDPQHLNGLRAPKIEIVSPADGLSTKETSIEVYGVVSDPQVVQVQLYVGETAVTVPVVAGVFKHVVTLKKGVNALSASASVSDGSSATASGHSSANYVEVVESAPQSHCISGIVIDTETGYPVVNAQVSLQGTGFYAYTNSLGTWFLNDVPTGAFVVDVLP